MTTRPDRKTFKRGKVFVDYEIIRLIGQGGFADIYSVNDVNDNKLYALKVENMNSKKASIEIEAEILQMLKKKASYFPKYINGGETKHNYRYVVMELLGPSLTTIRKKLSSQKFSISTTLRLGIEMIRAISDFHSFGYIHRDIKPANFLLRPSHTVPLALIDYGLARRIIDKDTQKHLDPRPKAGFVGTSKYASLMSHDCQDLSERDDMISWFYSLLEMATGKLPWIELRDKNQIRESKQDAENDHFKEFCKELPVEFISIHRCISQYTFKDTPNYKLLISFLDKAMKDRNIKWTDPFDWEPGGEYELTARQMEQISVLSMKYPEDEQPDIPTDLPPPIVPGDPIPEPETNGEPAKEEDIKGCCNIQ